ncbi:hypothetical protein ACOQNP_15115 [Ectopseudomonas khazarica]|uniref:hypothetical protein n=1 Tax=Ectopseudomonas khazarica TaxID=2502979 RepID=UPI0009DEBF39
MIRNVRKSLDSIASNNEDAAFALMRAAENTRDEVLRQQMLRLVHRLNQDAVNLRMLRDEVSYVGEKRA